jgi:hypothetical protein
MTPFVASKEIALRYQNSNNLIDSFKDIYNQEGVADAVEALLQSKLDYLLSIINCSVQSLVDDVDPYLAYKALATNVIENKTLLMYNYSKYDLIRPCSYSMLRTIHDLQHVILDTGFEYSNEMFMFDVLSKYLGINRKDEYTTEDDTTEETARWILFHLIRNIKYYVALNVNGLEALADNKVVLRNLFYV